jgi:uncharacterized protein (UPF0297 family)
MNRNKEKHKKKINQIMNDIYKSSVERGFQPNGLIERKPNDDVEVDIE